MGDVNGERGVQGPREGDGAEPCRRLYIHIPFCSGKCSYCAFYSEPYTRTAAEGYLRVLEAELVDAVAASRVAVPETLYVGGGSPSILGVSQLSELLAIIARRVELTHVTEHTVECNPGSIDSYKLAVLRQAGVTRISFGAQSMADGALTTAGRNHTTEELIQSIRACRTAGFEDISLDLIAGLSGYTPSRWKTTLRRTLEQGATHVSVYGLMLEEGSRLARLHEQGTIELPGDDAQIEALGEAERTLEAAGYERYEISNYALPGFRCRHNVAYWEGRDYLGLGPSAASRWGCRRWTNAADLAAYTEAATSAGCWPREEERVDAVTDAVERLVFGLRLAEGISFRRVAALPVARQWQTTLVGLAGDGLVRADSGRWRLTDRGRLLADYVARELMSIDS